MSYRTNPLNSLPGLHGYWLSILVLILLWPLLSIASDFEKYLGDAQAYFDKGKYNHAIIQLKNALLIDPDNGEARLLLGKAYLGLENGFSAEKELQRAKELGIAREAVLKPLGRAYLITGQNDKLIQTISQEAGDPNQLRVDILLLQGEAYLANKAIAMAEEKFSRALELQPASAEALLGKARIAYQNKDTAAAAEFLDRSMSTDPNNDDAWYLQGLLLHEAGNQQEAADTFQKVLDMEPNNIMARLGLATAFSMLGRQDEALDVINLVPEKYQEQYQINYIKAQAYYRKNELSKAQESAQKVLMQAPAYTPGYLLAGAIAYQMGALNQAEEYLGRYWNKDPSNQQVTKLLATILLKLNKPDKAIDLMEPVSESAANDMQYLALLGSAYLKHGDAVKGTKYLEKAAALAPDTAGIRAQLAVGHLALGEDDKAISELEAAVDLGQETFQMDVLLVMAYLGKKDYDNALANTKALMEKTPDSPVLYNLKGAALFGKGDIKAAKASFESALKVQENFVPAILNLTKLDLLVGDIAAAKGHYKTALSFDEGNLRALLGLAMLANRSGKTDEAEQWLREAYNHHPEAVEPAVLLVKHYRQQNDRSRAMDVAQRIVLTHPRDPTALRVLAFAQLESGQYEKGLTTSKSLIEVTPQSPEAHYLLALMQLKLKQTEDAKVSLKQAIKLKQDFPEAELALGRLEISKKAFDAGRRIANDLKQNHPDAAHGYELEGDVYVAQREPGKAAEAYSLAYTKVASAALANKVFQTRLQIGETESAYVALRNWLSERPDDTLTRIFLATSLESAGHKGQAIKEYLNVLEYDPDNVLALNNVAFLYQVAGNPEGVKFAERAHELAPERPEITDTLGWLLVQNGDVNRGLVLLQEARVKAPHIPDIHYHMAVALYKSGRTAEARKELDRLLKTGKTFSERDNAIAFRDQLANQ